MEPMVEGVGLNLTGMDDGRLEALDAVLADHAAVGCTHVELTARRLDLVVGGRLFAPRVAAVAEACARAGLKPVLHANHGINLMDADAAIHEAVASASIEACRRLGAHSMVLHSGVAPTDVWVERGPALLAAERDALRRLGDQAAAAGARLAVENLIAKPGAPLTSYGAHPARLAEQIAAVDHPAVGVCLDFGHAFLSAGPLGFDYLAELEALSPFVWHLHLHDNCGRPAPAGPSDGGDDAALGRGDMHAPMYLGAIPWDALLPRMRFRPRTFGGIELNWRYWAERARVVATAHAFAAFLNGGPAPANPFEAQS